MTREEYEKTYVRMMDSMRDAEFKGARNCGGVVCTEEGCPLYELCGKSVGSKIYNAPKFMMAVEKWGEEHPLVADTKDVIYRWRQGLGRTILSTLRATFELGLGNRGRGDDGMTREEREEAIAILEEVRVIDDTMFQFNSAYLKALEMAIEALKAEPCEDAVSREAVIKAMYDLCDTGETLKENSWRDNPHIDAIIDTIENLPPVTPERPKGEWIKHKDNGTSVCSKCFTWMDIDNAKWYNFCPNCGADM